MKTLTILLLITSLLLGKETVLLRNSEGKEINVCLIDKTDKIVKCRFFRESKIFNIPLETLDKSSVHLINEWYIKGGSMSSKIEIPSLSGNIHILLEVPNNRNLGLVTTAEMDFRVEKVKLESIPKKSSLTIKLPEITQNRKGREINSVIDGTIELYSKEFTTKPITNYAIYVHSDNSKLISSTTKGKFYKDPLEIIKKRRDDF